MVILSIWYKLNKIKLTSTPETWGAKKIIKMKNNYKNKASQLKRGSNSRFKSVLIKIGDRLNNWLNSKLTSVKDKARKRLTLSIPITTIDDLQKQAEIGKGVILVADDALGVANFINIIAEKEGCSVNEGEMFKILRKNNLIKKSSVFPTGYALKNGYMIIKNSGTSSLITEKGRNAYWTIIVADIEKLKGLSD